MTYWNDVENGATTVLAKMPVRCECGASLEFDWSRRKQSTYWIAGKCAACGHKYASVAVQLPDYMSGDVRYAVAFDVCALLGDYSASGMDWPQFRLDRHLLYINDKFGIRPCCLSWQVEDFFRANIPHMSTGALGYYMREMNAGRYIASDSSELCRSVMMSELEQRGRAEVSITNDHA